MQSQTFLFIRETNINVKCYFSSWKKIVSAVCCSGFQCYFKAHLYYYFILYSSTCLTNAMTLGKPPSCSYFINTFKRYSYCFVPITTMGGQIQSLISYDSTSFSVFGVFFSLGCSSFSLGVIAIQ